MCTSIDFGPEHEVVGHHLPAWIPDRVRGFIRALVGHCVPASYLANKESFGIIHVDTQHPVLHRMPSVARVVLSTELKQPVFANQTLPPSFHPTCLTCGAPHNGVVLVHSLKELPNDQGHRLDPLYLLLSIEVLCTQVLELILNIVLLNLHVHVHNNRQPDGVNL